MLVVDATVVVVLTVVAPLLDRAVVVLPTLVELVELDTAVLKLVWVVLEDDAPPALLAEATLVLLPPCIGLDEDADPEDPFVPEPPSVSPIV